MKFKKKLILSLILLFLFLPKENYSQNEKCSYCKNEITNGQYLQVDGKFFHSEHFKCSQCRKIIKGNYYSHEGKYFHEKCYKNSILEKCAQCYKPIEGEYVNSSGKVYHKKCFENHVALKCSHCGKTILGKFYQDFWGNKYHWEHLDKEKQCDYCQRLISYKVSGGGKKLADGRTVCNHCNKSAVNNLRKAKQFLDEAKFKLKIQGIRIENVEIELHLVDLDELKNIVKDGHSKNNVRGYSTYNYEKLNGEIIKKEFDIYILNNMHESFFISVAAHELMHIWQFVNSPEDNEKILSEGSCEYASYIVVKSSYDKYYKYVKKNLEENDDPVYGAGFKRVKKMVDDKGKNYWLNILKTSKDFPRGY
jgi:LIM domain-containing protein